MKSIVPISKFKEGDTVQGFYLCVEKHLRHTRAGDLYLDLVLKDRTGQVQGKVWDKVEKFHQKFFTKFILPKKNNKNFSVIQNTDTMSGAEADKESFGK